jgi:CRISPR-associated protein (TIGR02710 family)
MAVAEVHSFDEHVARMQRIQRGEEAYGEGSPTLQATAFYVDHLLAEAAQRARAASALPDQQVDLLISVCGFAATPTLLTYELLQPRRLLVLRSQDATASVNLIGRYLIGGGRLDFEAFQHETVDPSDPLDMYGKIAKWLDGRDGRYAVIDITGGRKVMSAAAALAAWQLDLGLVYVENRFDPVSRQPLPGQDRLIILENPTALFGEQEMAKALEAFRSGAFEAARERYSDICDRVLTPGRARLMRELAELYRAWCDLDLIALPDGVAGVRASLDTVRREVTAVTAEAIEEQLAFAGRLAGGDPAAIVVSFYVLGRHYQRLGRHDFAALLFYRTIEACLTERLRLRYPGFDPEDCDYTLLGDARQVKGRYASVARLLDPPAAAGAPNRMTLFAAAVLLVAEGDDLARHAGFVDAVGDADPVRLEQLRQRTRARNKSVLAHGTQTISAGLTESLSVEAQQLLDGFWALHGDPVDLDAFCARLRFVRTDR